MARIAILTTFQEFNEWYSLTGIVRDQVRMLTEYGNEVFLFVNEKFNDKKNLFNNNPHCTIVKQIPFAHLHDYQVEEPLTEEHEKTALAMSSMLLNTLTEFKIDTVFTHDLVFTGWNKPYAIGMQYLQGIMPHIVWMHWIHSIPTRASDWWNMAKFGRNHFIIYPNKADTTLVAEAYRTTTSCVRVIPHIKDLRVMFNFPQDACDLIDAYPALMQADVVQIYPASSDRFESKRVAEVIKLLAFIKSLGHSVCLFIANQWATTVKHYANIKEYEEIGRRYGLIPGQDLIFSSLFPKDKYKVGVPSNILFSLMQLSNLFIFPTREETFGLVLPEVSLASGALCVLNSSLRLQMEVSGGNTMFFEFGSYQSALNKEPEEMDNYLRAIAITIMGRMYENDGILTRTHMRKKYNYDSLYAKYYAPIMAELHSYTTKEEAQ